jgi:DNA repair protein RadA/Sms
MSKTKTIFVCQECGTESPRWVGKCPGCGAWNSYVEETSTVSKNERRASAPEFDQKPVLLSEVVQDETKRFQTGINEFDNVLGGGIVPGAVVLIGGDPGIGKSTLSLQVSCRLAAQGKKVLYVSGEESIAQTSMRARRLGDVKKDLYIVNQIDLNAVTDYVKNMSPDVLVVDSIQVVYQPDLGSTPGSVSQVRECAAVLTQLAKTKGMPVFIIGHVTNEGMIAGPRVLEHIVDTVLYFEGERYSTYRVLRTTKNRFGSTNEIGVFEMTSAGLAEVSNPSEIFLAERPQGAAGSVVVPIMEGTRPFLVEVQGLVSRSSYGVVRQKAQGFDGNRLALLVAVLEKRLGLNLYDQDVFLNVVGGVRVDDPAADLAVVMSIASAFLDRPMCGETAVMGEVGLSAEVRSVSQLAMRINEAAKLGFKKCIIPKNNLRNEKELKNKQIEIISIGNVKEAMELGLGDKGQA